MNIFEVNISDDSKTGPSDTGSRFKYSRKKSDNCPSLHARPVFGNITNLIGRGKVEQAQYPKKPSNVSLNLGRRRRKNRKNKSRIPVTFKTIHNVFDKTGKRKCYKKRRFSGMEEQSHLNEDSWTEEIESNCANQVNMAADWSGEDDYNSPNHEKYIQTIVAFDIVRASFGKDIPLEEFLQQCKYTDFYIAASDNSPTEKISEGIDYVIRIMAYEQIRELKPCFHIRDFITDGRQANITHDMITTLADWMVEVQENFAFNHETIHLAWGLLYAYLDRSLTIARREIQLMACAAVMVACKHEERHMPRMSEFLYITDNAYSNEEFLDAERRLLTAIDFTIHRPNPYVFLRRFARILDTTNGMVQHMSRFLLESGMHSHSVNLHRDSQKAAAVLWLSRKVLRNSSFLSWQRRPEVARLQHLLNTNKAAKHFYLSCQQGDDSENSISSGNTNRHKSNRPHLLKSFSAITFHGKEPTAFVRRNSNGFQFLSQFYPEFKERIPLSSFDLNKQSTHHRLDGGMFQNIFSESDGYFGKESLYLPNASLNPNLCAILRTMRTADIQRQHIWPIVLEHMTGYSEAQLIPLALQYHVITLRLIAEVARGGTLADDPRCCSEPLLSPVSIADESVCDSTTGVYGTDEDSQSTKSSTDTHIARTYVPDIQTQRCVSPGGHQLRRQVVAKYCSSSFLNVADDYPQLSFENLIPHFPEIRCSDDCQCFVCHNLMTKSHNTQQNQLEQR